MFSHLHNVEMTRRYRKDHDLMGYEADDLLSIFDNLKEEDIWQYRYPSWEELHDWGSRNLSRKLCTVGPTSPTPSDGEIL